jgi:hypothetical protein
VVSTPILSFSCAKAGPCAEPIISAMTATVPINLFIVLPLWNSVRREGAGGDILDIKHLPWEALSLSKETARLTIFTATPGLPRKAASGMLNGLEH